LTIDDCGLGTLGRRFFWTAASFPGGACLEALAARAISAKGGSKLPQSKRGLRRLTAIVNRQSSIINHQSSIAKLPPMTLIIA
jgi:hypothetical protein